jgi:large subunit ribosomal protein L2
MINVVYTGKSGKIIDIMNDPMRTSPVLKVKYEDSTRGFLVAPQGAKVGDDIGFVMPLSKIPVGSQIFGIETYPNSGPKLCMAAGSFAVLVSSAGNSCIIQLPSKKQKTLDPECRASVGVPAGEGIQEKPMLKAGKKWIATHARGGRVYPRTSGVAMNPVDHPFGGRTKPGKPKTVSRSAPPGRKIGSIAARRTGKKK